MKKPAPMKKKKAENPFVLNAEVGLFRPVHGLAKLGRIVVVGKSLVTVEWSGGQRELFGRTGKSFFGSVDESGEPVEPRRGDQQVWGTEDEDPHLMIPSESAKQTFIAKQAEKKKRDDARKKEIERLEADPAHQKRQAALARYSEALTGIGHVETSWNKRENFRIELEDISPADMDVLIEAIRGILRRTK